MTTESLRGPSPRSAGRTMLNKVPEVTVWFWIIKILCTTVGESFADWINMTLGVGLNATAAIFTGILVVVLGAQFRLDRYVPVAYWLTVVVVSVTGTLYTDILTDTRGVPLRTSSTVFAIALAAVFAIWYARERTLSIHSIVTVPREAFYWLAVLVTFALGTAVGDWTLELTGWGPGTSVLLPAALIAAVTLGWRAGGDAVLSFWLAYILTRPLGANLGDWLASPRDAQGLGFGTAGTSVLFLALIAATVFYLTVTRVDVTVSRGGESVPAVAPARRRAVLGAFGVVATGTAALLFHASQQPHTSSLDEEEGSASTAASVQPIDPASAPDTRFGSAELTPFRRIVQDDLALLEAGDQAAATRRITDLETAWDEAEKTLRPEDPTGWTALDDRIDIALAQARAKNPDPSAERTALRNLATVLG